MKKVALLFLAAFGCVQCDTFDQIFVRNRSDHALMVAVCGWRYCDYF